ncbi:MAG TPA: phosphosulfolactate synthase [Nitrososphaerales archaeon]|nr:phosphosulfolactate synthase [Nitrososphaerales archaeon]
MSERILRGELPVLAREGKPRDKGLTIVSDHFGPLNKELLEASAEFIDYMKIGLSLPLILDRSTLVERIRYYHDLGIKVSSGGTLLQAAVKKRIVGQILEKLRSTGFDTVEISESAGDIPSETRLDILNSITKLSMDYIFEVGKKDPKHPVSTAYMISKIQEALDLKSPKVIIEAGPEGRGTGVYDSIGEISWDTLNEIVGRFGPPSLIFEAPKMSQRVELVLEFGPNVNLASVNAEDILVLEMQRLGLTTETLGVSPPIQNVEGSPAAKFIYHLIRTEHPIDQPTLIQRSGLPKRTLQAALSYLVEKGFVREVSDLSDLRRHKYTPR